MRSPSCPVTPRQQTVATTRTTNQTPTTIRRGSGGGTDVRTVFQRRLRVTGPSYQPVTRRCHGLPHLALCCRIVGTSVEGAAASAAFFDLDKTLISRSSTLAFGPSFYRHGLISRADMVRGAAAQLLFRLSGANHDRME